MTYYLLQSAALFLAVYFVGCWCGCFYRTIDAATAGANAKRPIPDRLPAGAVAASAAAMPGRGPMPAAAPQRTAPVQSVPSAAAAKTAAAPARPVPPAMPAPTPARGSPELTAAAAAAAAAMALRPAQAAIGTDDLKRIKGIGPEIERKLNTIGVRRYSEIAQWSSSDVVRVNREIGQDGRVQHENWIEQAQILARGGETAFSRRVDRREVADGSRDTWTPTAPNQVAKQAAAAAPMAPPPAPPSSPPSGISPMPAAAIGAAAAAAAAAATASLRQPASASAPPAPPAPPSSKVAAPAPPMPAKTAAPAMPPASKAAADAPAPAANQPISMRPAAGATSERRFVRLAAPEGRPDDLSLIGGIGDKIAGDLNRYGIYHFWQLSAMGPADIDYLESRLGYHGRMRREEWPEQAREQMAGKPPRARADRDRAPSAGSNQPGQGAGQARPVADGPPAVQPHQVAGGQTTPSRTADPGAHGHSHSHGPGHPHHKGASASTATTSPLPPGASASAQVSAPAAPPAKAAPMPPPPAQTAAVQVPAVQPAATVVATAASVAAAAVSAAAAATTLARPATPSSTVAASAAPAQDAVVQKADAGSLAAAAAQPSGDAAGGPTNPGWTPRSRPAAAGARSRDDLKRIKGVGVVIEKKLEALGVTSYPQIAGWGTPDVERVSNALDFKGRIEREQWVEQARILAAGGQTDFSRRMDRGDALGPKI